MSLTEVQDALVARLTSIECEGLGAHKRRSRAAARRAAIRKLVQLGYDQSHAELAAADAFEIFELQQLCEDVSP